MVDLAQVKLGKLAPKHDDRTLKLGDYLEPEGIPSIPASRAWDAGISSFGMMKNDTIGDCTCAAVGHQVQIWTANASSETTIADADIVTAYSAVSGYDPKTGANDNGAVELDVLNLWRKTGVGGHKLGAYAKVDVSRHDLVQAAIDLFGGVYIGVALPISAQNQVGGVWDVPKGGPHGSGEPGSWGGHAVVCIDYDANGLTCITWGALQKMSWAFWDAYVDEAYGIISAEWFKPDAQAPSGFDLAALTSDLSEISGGQPTPPTPTPPGPTPTWQPDQETANILAYGKAAFGWASDRYGEATDATAAKAATDEFLAAKGVVEEFAPYVKGTRKHAPSKPLPPVPSA